jgi:hypothetical protein
VTLPAPVGAEVGYLLATKASAAAEAAFLRSLSGDDFSTEELTNADYKQVANLVKRYANLLWGPRTPRWLLSPSSYAWAR